MKLKKILTLFSAFFTVFFDRIYYLPIFSKNFPYFPFFISEPLVARVVRLWRGPRHRLVQLPSRLRLSIPAPRKEGASRTGFQRKTHLQHYHWETVITALITRFPLVTNASFPNHSNSPVFCVSSIFLFLVGSKWNMCKVRDFIIKAMRIYS